MQLYGFQFFWERIILYTKPNKFNFSILSSLTSRLGTWQWLVPGQPQNTEFVWFRWNFIHWRQSKIVSYLLSTKNPSEADCQDLLLNDGINSCNGTMKWETGRGILKNGISNHAQALMSCWLGAPKGADFDAFRGTHLGSERHLRQQLLLWCLQGPLSPFLLLRTEICVDWVNLGLWEGPVVTDFGEIWVRRWKQQQKVL